MSISNDVVLTRRGRCWHRLTQPMQNGRSWAVCLSLLFLGLGLVTAVGALRHWRIGSEDWLFQPIWAAAFWAIAAKSFTRRGPERGMEVWHAAVPFLLILPAWAAWWSFPWFPSPWPDLAAGAIAALVVVVEGPRVRQEIRHVGTVGDPSLFACLLVAVIAVCGIVFRW